MKPLKDDTATVLFDTGRYTVCPCTYDDDGEEVTGYAIVYKADGTVQARGPAIGLALQTCYQWESVFNYHDANVKAMAKVRESGAEDGDLSALLENLDPSMFQKH